MKKYHLGDVLTITTGKVVSPRRMEAVYDILAYMTGEPVFTHQVPRAVEECAPALIEQHGFLQSIDASTVVDEPTCVAWMAEQVAQHGEFVWVKPLPTRDPQYDTPVADLIDAGVDPTKIIVVDE